MSNLSPPDVPRPPSTFTILRRYGAPDLDAYRPLTPWGVTGWRLARTLLEAHRDTLGLETIEPVGEGGLGWVFRARQVALRRDVALKVAKQTFDDPAHDPLVAQSTIMARLDHRSVPRVYGAGRLPQDGPRFLVMEWIAGETLAQALTSGRADAAREGWRRGTGAVWLARVGEVATALAFAHRQREHHGDVKPENILLPAEPGRPAVLLDWAGAAATAPQLGTPGHEPPTGHRAKDAGAGAPAADVQALAMTLGTVLAAGAPVPPALVGIGARAPGIESARRIAEDLRAFLQAPTRPRGAEPDRDADTRAP